MNELFRKVAHRFSKVAGSAWTFCFALFGLLLWGISGFFFEFSNTWQLFVNTVTTIFTFLMVFLIQNTQNRDAQATQLKLDELIKALGRARDDFIDIEDERQDRIESMEQEFKKIHEKAEKRSHPNQ